MRPVRLLPLVAFAAFCLFVLKLAGLMFSGGYMLSGAAPASAQDTEAAAAAEQEQAAADPEASKKEDGGADAAKVGAENEAEGKPATETADTGEKKDDAATQTAAAGKDPKAPAGPVNGPATGSQAAPTSAELALLQSLSKRRKDLEKRERELQLRENLLKAAEQRVQKRITQLKAIESRIEKTHKKKDEERDKQLAGLVKMYSGMKPKKAAKIFNRLDLEVLKGLAKRIKPRAMAEILAAMETKAAQRLTLELAHESRAVPGPNSALPKIQSPNPR